MTNSPRDKKKKKKEKQKHSLVDGENSFNVFLQM